MGERNRWLVYVCSECGELNLYPGVCDNRTRHGDPHANIVLTSTPVERVKPLETTADKLPGLQQPEGIRSQGGGEP